MPKLPKFNLLKRARKGPKTIVFRERSVHKRFKKPASYRKLFLVSLPILAAVILLIFIRANPFQVKNLVFKNSVSCASNFEISKEVNLGKANLLTFNVSQAKKVLKDKYLCLQSVDFKRKYPATLEISLTERQTAYLVKTWQLSGVNLDLNEATPSSQDAIVNVDNFDNATPSGEFISDEGGFIFSKETSQNLPVVNLYNFDLRLGSGIRDSIIPKISTILQKMMQLGIVAKNIRVATDSIFIESFPDINFSVNNDLTRQLISLQLILENAKMATKPLSKVDLRFDKVVLTYSTKGNP